MIYSLSLETALLLAGCILIVAHLAAFFQPEPVQGWLKAFPRSSFWGAVLIVAAGAWFWWLGMTMDLHEFSTWRPLLKFGVPVATFLTWRYVPEFLSVRALGMLVLLGAEAVLEAAWQRPELSRLWLVSLVYVWITAALFWVGMPYTLRDQIGWATANSRRWNLLALGGVAYGVLLVLIRVLTLHR
ncbi:MAG: hypothetical protein ABMA13_14460 [Chthoniobacteraceae bacterium]